MEIERKWLTDGWPQGLEEQRRGHRQARAEYGGLLDRDAGRILTVYFGKAKSG